MTMYDTPTQRPAARPVAVADNLTIAAFVLAFVVPLVGAIMGHVSRRQAKRAGMRPNALATWAVWLGYTFTAVSATIATVLIVSLGAAVNQAANAGSHPVTAPSVYDPLPTPPPPSDAAPAVIGGEGFTWSDDVKAAVPSVTITTIGQLAAGGHPGDPAIIVSVRLTAGHSTLDVSDLSVDANAGPGGAQLEPVFDTHIDNPSGSLPPGRSGTYKFEFDVQQRSWAKKLIITVTPGFDYDAATFVNL